MSHMENLYEITKNSYICTTQAGFRKLLKKLNIHYRKNDKRWYSCDVIQVTDKPEAFYEVKYKYKYSSGVYKQSVNYPIQYPCLITIQDETFGRGLYIFNIRYFDDKLKTLLKRMI